MGILKMKEETLNKKTSVIREVLDYFSSKEGEFSSEVIQQIAAAADHAYSDDILFEEFENWSNQKDDETFLFLVNDYWNSKSMPILKGQERDLTNKSHLVDEIKSSTKKEQAREFSILLNQLVSERGLNTLDDIGGFLGVSAERARVLLCGKHKPQRKTIALIAEKFGIESSQILKSIL